jgi:hypothetical protein
MFRQYRKYTWKFFNISTYGNRIKMIVANGKGVSLYNKIGLDLVPLKGWVWEISSNTQLPFGLKLNKDDRPEGHYTICPFRNMPVNEFVGLLERIVVHCKKVYKKKAKGV